MQRDKIFDRQRARQTRNKLIDVLRGIAIFLMIWGHCIQYCCMGSFDFFENNIFKAIYSFHMPLFMLISGYLFFGSFQRRTLKELVIHRTKQLLHPIIMCAILLFLLYDVMLGVAAGNAFMFVTGVEIYYFEEYWFLWSVLSASLAVGIACKVSDRKWVNMLLLIIGIVFVCIMPGRELNVFMYPYFILGFIYADVEDSFIMRRYSRIKYLSLILFPLFLQFYTKEHYIYTSGLVGNEGLVRHMPINIYRWLIGLVGSVFTIVIVEIVYKILKRRMSKWKFVTFLEKLGIFSLQIYILQRIFLEKYLPIIYGKLISFVGINLFAQKMLLYNFFTFIMAVLYAVALLLLVLIFKKLKLNRLFFGK